MGFHAPASISSDLFSGGVVDEDFLEELEFALISADVGVETTTHILERLRSDIKLQGLKTQEEVKLALRDELVTILKPAEGVLNVDQAKPCVIMMCGVNGAGKTTVSVNLPNVSPTTARASF